MTNKVVLWVGGVVAVLLVAVLVVVLLLVNTINAQAEDQRYSECMASQGFVRGEQPPPVSTDDELDAYLDDAVDAAEFCSR